MLVNNIISNLSYSPHERKKETGRRKVLSIRHSSYLHTVTQFQSDKQYLLNLAEYFLKKKLKMEVKSRLKQIQLISQIRQKKQESLCCHCQV
jgi:hypothetical protein